MLTSTLGPVLFRSIGFEGPDGCHKTELACLLCSALNQIGKEAAVISFPVFETPAGRLLANLGQLGLEGPAVPFFLPEIEWKQLDQLANGC